jgi:CRISPR/Cas system CSM-associated protein Csm3 (group 7 of RAMP superfamily)
MKSERIDVRYRLQCTSAWHCGTGLRLGLIHRSVTRDAQGFLYVPGSTLKGVLRDHATHLARLLDLEARYPHNLEQDIGEFAVRGDIISLIFGSRFRPGTLFFDDARLCKDDRDFFQSDQDEELHKRFMANQTETRTQVSLSRRTGTAQRSFLFTTEYGVPHVHFDGRIYGTLSGVPTIEGTTTYALVLLLAALRSLEQLGGNKSAGAGRVMCDLTQLQVEGTPQDVNEYLSLLPEFEYYALAEEEDV